MEQFYPLNYVYSNQGGEIAVALPHNYLQVTWKKHTEEEEFRQCIQMAKTVALDYNLHYWLCNMQRMNYMIVADQNWLVKEIFPVFGAGRKLRFAYLISPMGLEAMPAFRIHTLVQENRTLRDQMEIEVFLDLSEAQRWLTAAR